ncbi:hemoglobin/transferrin/lactoferrin receptor protein [Andreprevotia lacus DSM 23236]|uniref:Hemoglobin/transferrin/lactoferrin receptor protein n=1 Tax=Andreprevotia lacus DSM 23236 TaxID=1121001 RepID=A0A1W1XQX1_9NEIS|nr:TonB-dependent receptor [Andreprevotia lacus]SMC25898.1 hemoglobin/transferrin/lactoferrin receptor protein [Andreprevotia lacus DSM 23236]
MSTPLRQAIRLAFSPLPLSLATLLCAATAHAADDSAALDPVLVTAERGSDTNTVVRANRIEVEQASSLQDLFKQTPEVSVGGGLPTAQKLYVRGLSERMLNVTIDGAVQPESAYHHTGQVMIDPDLIKRVEIEAGTGAATAGPGALAGAVRFTTKSAKDLLQPGERAGGSLKGSYQSVNDGYKLDASAYGLLGDVASILASQSYEKGRDYKDGNGDRVVNSSSDVRDSFIKLDLGADAHKVQLAYEHYQDEGLRNKRTNLGPAPFNPTERQRTERDSFTANYDYVSGNPWLNLHATAFFNKNQIKLNLDKPSMENDGTRSQGLNLTNVSRLGDHKLSYGLNYRHDTVFANIPDTPLDNETSSVVGLFLQDDWALNEQWTLTAGGRYDRYSYTDKYKQDYSSSGFSPSASVAYSPIESLTLRLSHARALRGVGITEPFLLQYQDNAPSIAPEKASNTELSATWEQNGWHASATVFRQKIANFIGYDDFHQNLGTVKVSGYSSSFGYQTQQWSASLGMSYSKPTLNDQPLSDDNALLLGQSTGRTWVAQVDYAFPAQFVKLGWTGRYVEAYDYRPTGAKDPGSKPGYAVHDIYAQWLPTGKDSLKLTLTVKNLFDHFYYDQSSFGYRTPWGGQSALAEPGRDVRLALAVKF